MKLFFKEWLQLAEKLSAGSGKLRLIGGNMYSGQYGNFNVLLTMDANGVNVNLLTSNPSRPAGENFMQYVPEFVNDLCGLGADLNRVTFKAMDQGGETRTRARERMFQGMIAKVKQMLATNPPPNCTQQQQAPVQTTQQKPKKQIPVWWKGPPEEYLAFMGGQD